MRILFILIAFAACSPNVDTRGHIGEQGAYAEIKAGETTRNQVLELLGSPSATASFGGETWYYITAKKKSFAFFAPEIVDQNVFRVVFGTDGVVSAATSFDKSKMQKIEIAKKETTTEGHELTFIEQLLGNVGRFNAPGTTPGSSPGGVSGSRQGGRR